MRDALSSEYFPSMTYRAGISPSRYAAMRATSLITAALLCFSSGYAQGSEPVGAHSAAASPYRYADIADLVTQAQAVAVIRARSFAKVARSGSADASAPQRYYVEAQVDSLIRGNGGLPPRIGFLMDVGPGVNPARTLKGRPHLIFGNAGSRSGQFQLLSSSAILPSSPAAEAQARSIAAEVVAPDVAPAIARIVEAFHVQGTVAGESETQIFLATRTGRPVSLSIVRRPSEEPRYGAALGEIVDEAAALPAPDTLLWYRLACSLPAALPAGATAKLAADDAQAAASDYRSLVERLAPCTRTRAAASPGAPLGNGAPPR